MIPLFQHTAARRRLAELQFQPNPINRFQHTAARRRLAPFFFKTHEWTRVSTHSRPKAAGKSCHPRRRSSHVSTHSRPKAAGDPNIKNKKSTAVSTHSRPKAAGPDMGYESLRGEFQHTAARRRLARSRFWTGRRRQCFNTQPPEGGWPNKHHAGRDDIRVSTHSRPKAAGYLLTSKTLFYIRVSTHSRPKAAG